MPSGADPHKPDPNRADPNRADPNKPEPDEAEMPPAVTPEALGELTVLGSGGQGTVYAVTGHRLESGPAAYKEFSEDVREALDVTALESMIRLRTVIPPPVAQRLDEVAAWPATVVERDGRVTGFLMRQAPAAFHTEISLPSGRVRRLAEVQLLLNGERYLTARGLAVDDRFRLELLRDVAQAIEMLHGVGVVVGDLSPNNLLFSRDHRPRCFFLDCDAMRIGGASVLEQAETVDWAAPAGDEVATPATDSYKFALLCARLFAGDQTVRLAPPADRVGPALRLLVVRGMSADPRQRPDMGQWRRALAGTRPRGRAVAETPRRWALPVGAAAAAVLLLIALILPLRGCSTWLGGVGMDTPGDAEQANGVARLLDDSRRSRDHLNAAMSTACAGPDRAAADLRAVAGERRAQLERVAALHVDLLADGDALRDSLGVAFERARQAAAAYAVWAQRCRSTVDRQRGDAAARQADAAWKQVAVYWNPIADERGHPRASAQEL